MLVKNLFLKLDKKMKIKVCGMRDKENIESLIALKPDFMGFIFYDKSKRFVTDFPKVKIPSIIKKVGVFVNETVEEVISIVEKYQLDCVQLHGDESPEYCKKMLNSYLERSRKINSDSVKLGIIKAFSVDENFDFNTTKQYENCCNYFLFDTKGNDYGGNGIKFNWEILQNYEENIPFLLSGGISANDVNEIKRISHPKFMGVDVNSGFEIKPGLKDIEKLKEFKSNLL